MNKIIITLLLLLVSGCTCRPPEDNVTESDNSVPDNCLGLESDIKDLLNELNYCDSDSDCMATEYAICPFGCFPPVNKNANLNYLYTLMKEYSEQGCSECVYKCMSPDRLEFSCSDNKCVWKSI